jgi:hypothetical protein
MTSSMGETDETTRKSSLDPPRSTATLTFDPVATRENGCIVGIDHRRRGAVLLTTGTPMTTSAEFDRVAATQRTALTSNQRDDRQLIRCATLAASSHNTQPWRFRVGPDAITIVADFARRCPVVDPGDTHLFKSLGCAVENLVQAAAAQGLTTNVEFDDDNDAIVVGLSPSPSATAPTGELFEAISVRQSTRHAFDSTPIATDELAALQLAASGPGVRTVMITDPDRLESIAGLVAEGDMAQLTDRPFRRELLSWIRFNPSAALRTGDGLAGRCTGNPSVPTSLGRLLSPLAIRARPQARTDTANIRSSAGVAVFATDTDDKLAWIEAGRAYQRFALQAAVFDIRTAFINQPIEVLALRPRFDALAGLDGEHAQLAVRFGHGELTPYSVRRPVDEVVDTTPEHPTGPPTTDTNPLNASVRQRQ